MDSYFAILEDFTKEVKRACKRADKGDPGDPNTLLDLLNTLDDTLGKVRERHMPTGKKKRKKK